MLCQRRLFSASWKCYYAYNSYNLYLCYVKDDFSLHLENIMQIILRFSIVIPTEKAVICKSFVCYVYILFVYVLTATGCIRNRRNAWVKVRVPTGCPTKHDSSKTNWTWSLILEFICDNQSSTYLNVYASGNNDHKICLVLGFPKCCLPFFCC